MSAFVACMSCASSCCLLLMPLMLIWMILRFVSLGGVICICVCEVCFGACEVVVGFGACEVVVGLGAVVCVCCVQVHVPVYCTLLESFERLLRVMFVHFV